MVSTVVASALDYVYNPSGLRRAWVGMGNALNARCIINWNGDSLAHGLDALGTNDVGDNATIDGLSPAGQLRQLFAKRYGGGGGVITPRFQGTDSRYGSTGSPAALTTSSLMAMGRSVTNAQTMTFTLPACTAFDILGRHIQGTTGAFSYAVDGGGAVTVTRTAPDGAKTTRVTGLSDAAHTVVITGTTASPAYITGIRYDSGFGVQVCRHGQPSWTVNDVTGISVRTGGANNFSAIGNTAGQARLLDEVGAYGAVLDIWQLGTNDCTYQDVEGTTPDYFGQRMEAFIAQRIAAGGCALLLGSAVPPTDSTPIGGEPPSAYHAVMKEIALGTDHCAFLNLNDIVGTATNAVDLGLHSPADSVHLSKPGIGVTAHALFNVLTPNFPLAAWAPPTP